MNRREVFLGAAALALAPVLPMEAGEASPFPPLYWRFTTADGYRRTRCGFPFDEAARSVLKHGVISKVERMDNLVWREMTIFGHGTLTHEHIDMMVRNERAWQAHLSRRALDRDEPV